MPLTQPNYFTTGAQFPPDGEAKRQRDLRDQKILYENTPRAFQILNPPEGDTGVPLQKRFVTLDGTTVSYPKYRVNLFRKISNFWKDMLFAFPPIVDAQSRGENRNIDDLIQKILRASTNVAIDTSRYGTGVYLFTQDENNEFRVEAVEALYWFPVVSVEDPRKILGDIIAVPYTSQPDRKDTVHHDRIRVSRFIIGQPATIQIFKMEGNILQGQLEKFEQGVVEQRPIVTVPNGYELDHYGESDYLDLLDLVSEMNRRISSNSVVLDRHTNPHMQGPRSAIKVVNGKAQIDIAGSYLPLDEDDQRAEYITWDADLEANFTQMQRVMDLFFAMSNTSATALGMQDQGTNSTTGAALRKQLYSSFLLSLIHI